MHSFVFLLAAALVGRSAAYDSQFKFDAAPIVETRSIDEIHQAALAEGGVVTCWHGGDEKTQQDGLKQAFEERFPGMTLNITVDLSKYHDVNIDQQLATDSLYVDSVILQTLHDFPRWDQEGALLHYAPQGFSDLHPNFRDVRAAWYGIAVFGWTFIVNSDKLDAAPKEFPDFLKPEFKDKLVLTYPNDDDAVLYAFDLIMQQYGYGWFESLLAQNPRWVRGTATPVTLIATPNNTLSATFTSAVGLTPPAPLNISIPTEGTFVTWPQRGAILKNAPHPEGAKLLHNFILTQDHQKNLGSWSVRKDVPAPAGFADIMDIPATNPTEFERFMGDRARVERLKLFFEDKIGTAQGLSPLIDDL
ncbi:ABC transporter [Camillea tinctor]|nr:ABC transporter [Camillea tinctor]